MPGSIAIFAARKSRHLALSLHFILILLIFGVIASSAQDGAAIHGTVSDATGSAIAGGAVRIKNLETGLVRALTTDESGRYEAPALPVGAYEVSAEKAGFQSARARLNLVLGQRASLEIVLAVAELQQNVQVQETAISADVTTMETSGLVGERQVKDLPLNGRSYDQLLTLNPGVVNYTSQRAGSTATNNSVVGNMFSASGRRPQENLYVLNGVEFTSASEINNTPGGVSGQLLGVDAVREFAVVKDTYGAEYGKRPGAQINIVTASGTNGVHGSAYEFLRNSGLDARNFFDYGAIPQFQRNVFGASLGGPVKKDKTFLFANYEGFRQSLGLSDVTFVPDNASRASAVASVQPLLALWPVANGPELLTSTGAPSGIAEAFSNPVQHIREDFGTTRFDQNFSGRDSFAAIYTVDDSNGNSPTTNPFSLVHTALREQVASLSETHVFSTNLINRATFGFSRGAFYYTGESVVSLPGFVRGGPIGAVVIGGSNAANAASQITPAGTNATSNLTAVRNLFTWSDQVTLTRSNHLISAGVWFQRIQVNDDLAQNQHGQATFSNLQSFLAGTVSTFTVIPSATLLGWRSLEGAAYLEDAIKLKPNLELRLGFRAESTDGWNEAHDRAANYLFDANGVVATQPVVGRSPLTVNNAKFLPSPRIGLAWSPSTSKKTVIRAGFGVYYALPDNLSYRLDNLAPFNAALILKNVPISSVMGNNAIVPGAPLPAGALVPPSGIQPDLKTPTVESYSLKIERQLPSNLSLSVGYIGSHAYHEMLTGDVNLPIPTICPASPCPAYYPSGAVYNPPNAPLANPKVAGTTTWLSEGVSSYNGLEVDVNRRLTRGLQFRGVYTLSKALDDGDTLNTTLATNSPAYLANSKDAKADYGRASFDIRHSAVINATYDLPFGRGKGGLAQRIFGDWQVSGIETLLSGIPFTPQLSYNPANDGNTRNSVRPSWNPNFTGAVIKGGPNQYFNLNAFITPLAGTYGNVGRDVLQGPGLATLDVSLAKKFSIAERLSLQFRSEFFNLLSRTNFNTPNPVVFTTGPTTPSPNPVASVPSSTAGVISATSTSSRQVQLGLKLLW
jgi:Carboxypeptidase regulatory-like domain